MESFAIKGDICYSKSPDELICAENSFAVCEDGKCSGVFSELPEKYNGIQIDDYSGKLIIPGLTDLHTHAPQYPFRGLGMDCELLQWLERHAFPEEEKYSDTEYAEKAYDVFADALLRSATTRACIFATIDVDSSLGLMDKLEKTGLVTYVGKVSMDRNSPDALTEKNAREALYEWLSRAAGYKNTRPIITPRFIPSCTDGLMRELAAAREKYSLPVQSHLSENPEEIKLVSRLCPNTKSYGDAYHSFGLFGRSGDGYFPTVMAHCVYPTDADIALMRENGVFAAHCPLSNTNLRSGIAPVRKLLKGGVKVGIGTDIAAGQSLSVLRNAAEAVSVSKLCQRLIDADCEPLSFAESFYLASKGGGAFFGKCGSFEEGYEFDAAVIGGGSEPSGLSAAQRLERYAFTESGSENVFAKYVRGIRVI